MHLLMDTLIVSICWLLWIKLQWTRNSDISFKSPFQLFFFNMSTPFTVLMVSWVLTYIQTHQISYIKCVQFFNVKPTPVLLSGKSHGLRSLVGCSPWGRWGSDTTERFHFHFSLSCIGEGNGNPLQCSCLENPRDGGVWWAAVYGVA